MRNDAEVFANYLLSLPQKVKSLREQATALSAEADSVEATLEHLDRSRLDCLKLTGNPKLDAALRLSMETGGYCGKYWLAEFPVILGKLERMEKEIADWKEGELMLADLTSQSSCPLCLELVILEVPANPHLQIVPTRGYFHNISISVQVPARLLIAWNSNTVIMGMEHCTDLSSAEYKFTEDRFKLETVCAERCTGSPILTTFDLTQLLHPNWGGHGMSSSLALCLENKQSRSTLRSGECSLTKGIAWGVPRLIGTSSSWTNSSMYAVRGLYQIAV